LRENASHPIFLNDGDAKFWIAAEMDLNKKELNSGAIKKIVPPLFAN
jgi:hypothetical protein